MQDRAQVELDFLRRRPFRSLLAWSGFPVLFQAVALGAVVWLAVIGFGLGTQAKADELMTLRKTNLTTLVVWGLWWPGMIALALAFGRAWCTVCPIELANRIADALARKVGWPRARLGRLLRAGWMTVVLYLVLQILVAGVSIHRVPHFTSLLLLALIAVAVLAGLVFRERRSFCKTLCPASALLSVYGRYTPVQLEARHPIVCRDCATKDCVRAENRDRLDKRSCPSALVPYRRGPSDGCVLCFQCAKVCPSGNMGFGFVTGSSPVRRKSTLLPFEAAFVMVALGFVAHEVIGEVKWLDAFFHFVPSHLQRLAPAVAFGWFEALWFLVLFPILVWGVIAGVAYLAGHRTGLRALLLAAATGAAPVVAVAHLAKAAAKIASWGSFLPLAIRDPHGVETLHRITDMSLAAPAPLASLPLVAWAMLAAMLLVGWKGWRWAHRMSEHSPTAARAGLAVAGVLFLAVLTIWALPAS
ncbi:MAG: 4Fe-4S binding protein [Planctomycetota bacterium]